MRDKYIAVERERYRYAHISLAEAKSLHSMTQEPFVVVSINWTLSRDGSVHRNTRIAWTLDEAIALAVEKIVQWREVAEDVVEIRAATSDEIKLLRVP